MITKQKEAIQIINDAIHSYHEEEIRDVSFAEYLLLCLERSGIELKDKYPEEPKKMTKDKSKELKKVTDPFKIRRRTK